MRVRVCKIYIHKLWLIMGEGGCNQPYSRDQEQTGRTHTNQSINPSIFWMCVCFVSVREFHMHQHNMCMSPTALTTFPLWGYI